MLSLAHKKNVCYHNSDLKYMQDSEGSKMEKFTYIIQFIVELIALVKKFFGSGSDSAQ